MKILHFLSTSIFSITFLFILDLSNVSNAEKINGEKIFMKCKSCHQIGSGAKNRVGPHLNKIDGRVVGSVDNFKYSNALLELKEKGDRWSKETLDEYLKNPSNFIKGTSMKFLGIKVDSDRQQLIDFLLQGSHTSQKSKIYETPLSEEILSIVGDRDYGKYLSSECITCHQSSGNNEGIPSITHWSVNSFVYALHSYKNGDRKHPIMEMITKRLSNEEIAALAIYFNSINN